MKGTSPSRVIRAFAGYGIQVPRWGVRTLINSLVCWKGKSMSIVTIGIEPELSALDRGDWSVRSNCGVHLLARYGGRQ
jgi:hypothetical protein